MNSDVLILAESSYQMFKHLKWVQWSSTVGHRLTAHTVFVCCCFCVKASVLCIAPSNLSTELIVWPASKQSWRQWAAHLRLTIIIQNFHWYFQIRSLVSITLLVIPRLHLSLPWGISILLQWYADYKLWWPIVAALSGEDATQWGDQYLDVTIR